MKAAHAEAGVQPVSFVRHPLGDEDFARANHYALISRLFHAAPDAALLQTLGASGDWPIDADAPSAEAMLMADAWNALCAAASVVDAESIGMEFDGLFGGVGRPAVVPFASFYLTGFMHEKPLVRLRDDLAALGLQRARGEAQPEDHIAALADVMRLLLTDTTRSPGERAAAQDVFLGTHIEPWYGAFLDALDAWPGANFYRRAGHYARCFLDIEVVARRIEP